MDCPGQPLPEAASSWLGDECAKWQWPVLAAAACLPVHACSMLLGTLRSYLEQNSNTGPGPPLPHPCAACSASHPHVVLPALARPGQVPVLPQLQVSLHAALHRICMLSRNTPTAPCTRIQGPCKDTAVDGIGPTVLQHVPAARQNCVQDATQDGIQRQGPSTQQRRQGCVPRSGTIHYAIARHIPC